MMEMQWSWWQGQIQIYQNVLMRSVAKDVAPFIQPESGDRRFNSPLWQDTEILTCCHSLIYCLAS